MNTDDSKVIHRNERYSPVMVQMYKVANDKLLGRIRLRYHTRPFSTLNIGHKWDMNQKRSQINRDWWVPVSSNLQHQAFTSAAVHVNILHAHAVYRFSLHSVLSRQYINAASLLLVSCRCALNLLCGSYFMSCIESALADSCISIMYSHLSRSNRSRLSVSVCRWNSLSKQFRGEKAPAVVV